MCHTLRVIGMELGNIKTKLEFAAQISDLSLDEFMLETFLL